MYEADDKSYTVNDEIDLKMCWDSVDEMHLRTRAAGQKPAPSAHLSVFIMDMDPTKFAASTRKRGCFYFPARKTVNAEP